MLAKNIQILEKIIIVWILNNLTSEYDTFIIIITQSIRVNGANSIKMKILFFTFIDESKSILNRNDNSILVTKRKKNKIDENVSKKKLKYTNCKKTEHLEKKCYFSHSELKLKSKKFKNKSSSSRIEEESINNSLEMTMTAQTIKYMREHSMLIVITWYVKVDQIKRTIRSTKIETMKL